MYFRHNVDDSIEINGVKFDYETFLSVEPNYIKPVGMSWRHYEQGSTHQIITIDGSQTSGEFPWEDGDRYISRLGDLKMMQKEEEEDKKLVASISEVIPKKETKPKGKGDLREKVEAMWDYLIRNMPREDTIDPILKQELNKETQKSLQNEYEDLL